MIKLLQLAFSGVAIGSVYGLIALGFVVAFKATKIFNFAQGDFMLVGAYLSVTGMQVLHLPVLLTVALVIVAGGVCGVLLHYVLVRPLLGQPLLTVVMATIALSLIMEALLQIIYGPAERALHSPLPRSTYVVGGVRLSALYLTILVVSVSCAVLFGLFFRYSKTGLQMRAVADEHEAALLAGIDVGRVYVLAFAISIALATLGGFFLANVELVSVGLSSLGLLAFPALFIGGLESVPGAIVGGILVGLLQQLGAGYISPDAQDAIVYIGLLVVLSVRPYGLFGEREIRRA